MADLRALVAGLGYGDVTTYLQSGNVVCTGGGRADEVAAAVATALSGELGLSVPVVGRTAARGAQWWPTIRWPGSTTIPRTST